jgi:hypothetical protein
MDHFHQISSRWLVERTGTIAPLENGLIEERLKMFDKLWGESPSRNSSNDGRNGRCFSHPERFADVQDTLKLDRGELLAKFAEWLTRRATFPLSAHGLV